MESGSNEIKMYSDFKSPYAYLAFDPGMALSERFDVSVRWIPFQLRLKGKGERSVYSEYKVKYSYMDARRWAKARGLWIRGPDIRSLYAEDVLVRDSSGDHSRGWRS